VSLLFGYSSIYAIERGNIILFTIVFVLVFWFFKDSPNKVVSELALLSLGVAAGIKLYPAAFAFVLLVDRQWARAARVTLYGLLLFVLPFYFFEGTRAIPIFFATLFRFSERAVWDGFGLMNYFEVLSSVLAANGHDVASLEGGVKLGGYVLDVLLLVFAWRADKRWKTALYIAFVVILTQAASEYALLFLLIAFVAFLNEEPCLNRSNAFYFACFASLILPLPLPGLISISPYYTWKIMSLQAVLAALFVGAVVDGTLSFARRKPAQVVGGGAVESVG
jgi:hypothetical protein